MCLRGRVVRITIVAGIAALVLFMVVLHGEWFGGRRALADDSPIRFDQDHYACGEVLAGVEQVIPVVFENSGQEAIRILKGHSSCSCNGRIGYPHEEIAPGAGGVIELTYKPRVGPQKARFLVETTSGPAAPIYISYKGVAGEKLSTSYIDFGSVPSGCGTKRDLLLLGSRDLNTHREISFPSLPVWLSVEREEPAAATIAVDAACRSLSGSLENLFGAPIARIRIRILPGAPKGYFRKTVGVKVEDAVGERLLTCDVSGRVVDEIYTIPDRVILHGSSTNRCTLQVKSLERAFKVVDIRPKSLTYDIVDEESGGCSVRLQIDGIAAISTTDQYIEVVTSHPGTPVVKVPVDVLRTTDYEAEHARFSPR